MKATVGVVSKPVVTVDKKVVSTTSLKQWVKSLESYRLIVLAITILFQGCISVPLAMWSMYSIVGVNDLQMLVIVAGSFSVLVTNLAVQPMSIIVSLFALSTVANLIIILSNLATLV